MWLSRLLPKRTANYAKNTAENPVSKTDYEYYPVKPRKLNDHQSAGFRPNALHQVPSLR